MDIIAGCKKNLRFTEWGCSGSHLDEFLPFGWDDVRLPVGDTVSAKLLI